MSDDTLAPFVRAYRQENPGNALDTGSIRRRVIVGIGSRQRRRAARLRFLLPVAATFFGSVALAATHGGLARWDDVRNLFGREERAPAPVERSAPHRHRAVQRAHADPPAASAVVPAAMSTTGVSLSDLPVERKPSAPHAEPLGVSVPTMSAESPSDPLRNDLAAYEAAHRLHFHANDPAGALSAWDSYLATHSGGVFAPEARFNRAICLIRLGRRSEAREVLERISEAKLGTYGRQRARDLLDAMGD